MCSHTHSMMYSFSYPLACAHDYRLVHLGSPALCIHTPKDAIPDPTRHRSRCRLQPRGPDAPVDYRLQRTTRMRGQSTTPALLPLARHVASRLNGTYPGT